MPYMMNSAQQQSRYINYSVAQQNNLASNEPVWNQIIEDSINDFQAINTDGTTNENGEQFLNRAEVTQFLGFDLSDNQFNFISQGDGEVSIKDTIRYTYYLQDSLGHTTNDFFSNAIGAPGNEQENVLNFAVNMFIDPSSPLHQANGEFSADGVVSDAETELGMDAIHYMPSVINQSLAGADETINMEFARYLDANPTVNTDGSAVQPPMDMAALDAFIQLFSLLGALPVQQSNMATMQPSTMVQQSTAPSMSNDEYHMALFITALLAAVSQAQ